MWITGDIWKMNWDGAGIHILIEDYGVLLVDKGLLLLLQRGHNV